MTTILVTGRNGFIGQELVPLIRKNNNVISVIRRKLVNVDYENENLILTDLSNISLTLVKNYKIDMIVHLAAQIRGSPKKIYTNNIASTQMISSIASSLDVPIIYTSTTNVFFNELLGNYSKSKKICEEIIKANNTRHIIIRVPLVIGMKSSSLKNVRDFYKKYHFFPLFGKQGGKTQPIHVSSINELIINILNNCDYTNREINLFGKKIYSYREIIKIIIGCNKKNIFIKFPFHFIYYITRTFEFFRIPFFITSEELISVNIDKILDESKIKNSIIVDNNENIIFN